MVGEWSLATSDCARYLNGRGIGARRDGTYPGFPSYGTCDGLSGSGENFTEWVVLSRSHLVVEIPNHDRKY